MPMSLTPSERLRRARLVAKAGWQTRGADTYSDGSTLPDPRVEREIDRIDRRGTERWEREADAHEDQVNGARRQVAAAKVALRTATGSEKAAARRAVRDGEQEVRRAETAARKHGLQI